MGEKTFLAFSHQDLLVVTAGAGDGAGLVFATDVSILSVGAGDTPSFDSSVAVVITEAFRDVSTLVSSSLTSVNDDFILFFVGMAFAYFAFFPMVFGFMSKFAPEGVAWMTDIEKYLSFVMTMFIAFGITFEVPVIVIVLTKLGVVTVPQLREWRSYVIVGAFAVAAVFTPPDVISQIMMAVPLCLLYELGIVMAAWLVKVPLDPNAARGDLSAATKD